MTSFRHLLWAEWIKFRSVRGWILGMVVAAVAIVGIALLDHSSCGGIVTPDGPQGNTGCTAPVGPGGEAVTDTFYFVHQPLTGDGSITARLTALTAGQGPAGLQPWSKAGIIVKASTRPGSAYAAMVGTAGHGVRMQYNYTGDVAAPSTAKWLRLTRAGSTLTGYQSADGTHWTVVTAVHLAGLPTTLQAGMFAASPTSTQAGAQSIGGSTSSGALTLATARFDGIALTGAGTAWAGDAVGGTQPGTGFQHSAGTVTVTGTGDIAPSVDGTPVERTMLGAFGGLIAVIVVAAMFVTAEYRRGLIRVTLAAAPSRGRVLAAKAVVVGAVSFVAALAGAIPAVLLGERLLRSNGNLVLPVGTLTELRSITGTAALLAVAAVLALAVGTILRRSAGAVTAGVTAIVLPYLLAAQTPVLAPAVARWLLRITPAAGFAIQQTTPHYAQVAADYTPANGFYPLPPWAGFAVLCAYTGLALALAVVLLNRRDA